MCGYMDHRWGRARDRAIDRDIWQKALGKVEGKLSVVVARLDRNKKTVQLKVEMEQINGEVGRVKQGCGLERKGSAIQECQIGVE